MFVAYSILILSIAFFKVTRKKARNFDFCTKNLKRHFSFFAYNLKNFKRTYSKFGLNRKLMEKGKDLVFTSWGDQWVLEEWEGDEAKTPKWLNYEHLLTRNIHFDNVSKLCQTAKYKFQHTVK